MESSDVAPIAGSDRRPVAAHAATMPDVAGDFDARLAFLRMLAREEASRSASVIETHMSWVFLTDRHAYKLKKPVRYDYLDFSTLEARRQSCEDEIRLNRRLAPDVYLAVVALRADAHGGMHLGGEDTLVDWLVKMRRLPADQMMDCAIEGKSLTRDDVRHVARYLSRFYQGCAPLAPDPFHVLFVGGLVCVALGALGAAVEARGTGWGAGAVAWSMVVYAVVLAALALGQ